MMESLLHFQFRVTFWDTDMQVASYCLHVFCDASKNAYAAVVYLVAQTGSDRCVRFVTSETRVAPF